VFKLTKSKSRSFFTHLQLKTSLLGEHKPVALPAAIPLASHLPLWKATHLAVGTQVVSAFAQRSRMTATLEILPYGLFRYSSLLCTRKALHRCVRLLSQSYNTVPPAACRLIAECLELTEFIALASTDRRRACLAMALWERERSPKVAAVAAVAAAAAAAKASNDKQAVNYSSVPAFRYLDSKHVSWQCTVQACHEIGCHLTDFFGMS
jgi:hypothetical protein